MTRRLDAALLIVALIGGYLATAPRPDQQQAGIPVPSIPAVPSSGAQSGTPVADPTPVPSAITGRATVGPVATTPGVGYGRRPSSPVRTAPVTWHRAVASSYGIGDGYLWRPMACGGVLTPTALVVAHRTLPCGTRVTFRFRGHVVTATVRDRGPFVAGRTWDFGPAVTRALHFGGLGVVEWHL